MEIQRIQRVNIREVWPHEARDFTTWLAENIDILDDDLASGIDPESVRREQSAGSFAVDLVAEDQNGETVVIEDQLGRSDHDHLGKLLTYIAAFDTDVAIWIVGDPRPEQVKAVTWINDSGQLSAYMFKMQAIRIGNSLPAPLVTLIVGPPESAKEVVASRQETSERRQSRRSFFEALLEYANSRTDLHSRVSAQSGPYVSTSSGHRGVALVYGVRKGGTSVIVWIDRQDAPAEWHDALFNYLHKRKEEIEESFGGELIWEAKETNRSRKVLALLESGGWADPETWPSAIETTVGRMIQLEQAIRPLIADAVREADSAAKSVNED